MKLNIEFEENEKGIEINTFGEIAIGKDGKSAYQVALDNGFTGTEEEWLESLHGPAGPAGKDGYTPVKDVDYFDGKDGYTPIKGKDYFDGEPGPKGDPGYTPIKGKDYFDGKDGYTPVKGKDYFDGKDGYTPVKGVDYFDGEKGADGYTPVKGVDYCTDADKAEMLSAVISALPVYDGEVVEA